MNLDLDILKIISNDVKPELGKILISEPLLNDVYFSRSVVYLIDDIDESFMGLVLNNPSEIKLRDVVEGFEGASHKLYIGGPVEPDVLFYIHTSSLVTGADLIANGLYFGGELDEIRELIKCGILNEENIKFFLGSSGWAPGQLNEEISFNSWLVANCDDDFIFCDDSEMWQNSLNFVESRYKIWRNFPLDPELN